MRATATTPRACGSQAGALPIGWPDAGRARSSQLARPRTIRPSSTTTHWRPATPTRTICRRPTSGSTSCPAPTGRRRSTGVSEGLGRTPTSRCSACCASSPTWCWSGRARCAPRTTAAPAGPTAGRDAPPPIAVVTGSADLDPGSTAVHRHRGRPDRAHPRISARGARASGSPRPAPTSSCSTGSPRTRCSASSARRGLHRVLCEGGPSLFGDAARRRRRGRAVPDAVAPLLAGGAAGRIARGPRRTRRRGLDAGRGAAGGRHAASCATAGMLRSGERPGPIGSTCRTGRAAEWSHEHETAHDP